MGLNFHKEWIDSGKTQYNPTEEDIWCELQLQAIGDWEPLKAKKVNLKQVENELKPYKDKWLDYLPKEGRANAREGLGVVGLPGDFPWDAISMPEARKRAGKYVREVDFNEPTQLYHDLKSVHHVLDNFLPLARSSLVRLNEGGWFVPHRDNVQLTRGTFRLILFLSENCASDAFRFELNGIERKIVPGLTYYAATQKTHVTHSYRKNSLHLIVNVPKTWENVLKVITLLSSAGQYTFQDSPSLESNYNV